MLKWRASLWVGALTLSAFSYEGRCPDLAGFWGCRLFVNGGAEPVYYSINIEQDVVGAAAVQYEIGGEKISARWDQETVNGTQKTRCIDERILMSWHEEGGVPYQSVYVRVSPTELRAEVIRLRPSYFENNQTVYVCDLRRP